MPKRQIDPLSSMRAYTNSCTLAFASALGRWIAEIERNGHGGITEALLFQEVQKTSGAADRAIKRYLAAIEEAKQGELK